MQVNLSKSTGNETCRFDRGRSARRRAWIAKVEKNLVAPTVGLMSSPDRPLPWKKVAVTGTAGQIGGATARRLHELGYSLVLLDRRPSVDLPHPSFQTDLRDRDAVRRVLEGVDAVCHLGEIPNILPGLTAQEVFDTNTAICRTMLEVSREVGVKRFIYTSSCQRYGYWGSHGFLTEKVAEVWPLDETQAPVAMNGYAESKVFNERQCETAAGAMQIFMYRFPWVHTIQPGERVQRYWKSADERLYEGFWTYLGLPDAAEAYILGLNPAGPDAASISNCEAFHFVSDEIVGDLPIQEKLRRFLPNWPALPSDWPTQKPPVSCAKAQRLLGWTPKCRMSAVIRSASEQTAS